MGRTSIFSHIRVHRFGIGLQERRSRDALVLSRQFSFFKGREAMPNYVTLAHCRALSLSRPSNSKKNTDGKSLVSGIDALKILKTMTAYIWPKGEIRTKIRVLFALGLLFAGKGVLVTVPYIFKLAIDALSEPAELTFVTGAGALLLGYGASRITAVLMQELRNSLFSSVAQGAIRSASKQTFAQLISLDSNFHVSRQTGSLVRAINRGTKGINQVLSSVVFHLFPTALELSIGK